MNRFLYNKGGSTPVGNFLIFLLVFAVFYLVVKYVPVYIGYGRVKLSFIEFSKEAYRFDNDQLRGELAYKFRTLKPPFDAREVTIKREDNRILIEHEYDVTVTHPGLEPHVIHFHPRDEREIINPIKQ